MKTHKNIQVEIAAFAGGCFWGIEDAFRHLKGVYDVVSGYSGGFIEKPTYQELCNGNTGHAETVLIKFNPKIVSYDTLARLFFEIHDPTQLNRQGPDIGSQYRSVIFYTCEKQKEIALKLINDLKDNGWKVVTSVEPLTTFFPAEDYHQRYLERTGRASCHFQVPRFEMTPPKNEIKS